MNISAGQSTDWCAVVKVFMVSFRNESDRTGFGSEQGEVLLENNYNAFTVMLVDDEKAVLEKLTGLIATLGCKIIPFESPVAALEHLATEKVDLIISDIRLPEMAQDCFLQEVSKRFPEIERIVLTEYSDAQATIDAINKGKISRFLQKPWDDDEVLKVVRKGFQLKQLQRDNDKLQQETQEKNAALRALNAELESKVDARTAQLKKANQQLTDSYRSIVRMFSTLIARRLGIKASGENQKLNKLMVGLAAKVDLSDQERRQLYYAWQLRHIGKLSFQDNLINVPYLNLNPEQQRVYQQHPVFAQAACHMVKPLYPAGQIILQHKEYLDGSG
jgi:response regulator RpfG family c-di-GMP phosphodiesterase